MGRPTVEKCKTVLCSLFNTAVNDRVVGLHPCHGVVTPSVVQAKLRILTPSEYAALNAHLRNDYPRLMVDVLLETGCRWGEFAELRVGDLDAHACTITVARTVVEVKPKYTQTGEEVFGEGVSEEQVLARRRDQPGAREPAHRAVLGPRSRGADVPRRRLADRAPLAAWRRRPRCRRRSRSTGVASRTARSTRTRRVRAGARRAGRRWRRTGRRGAGRVRGRGVGFCRVRGWGGISADFHAAFRALVDRQVISNLSCRPPHHGTVVAGGRSAWRRTGE